jgi:hypothetical protein
MSHDHNIYRRRPHGIPVVEGGVVWISDQIVEAGPDRRPQNVGFIDVGSAVNSGAQVYFLHPPSYTAA